MVQPSEMMSFNGCFKAREQEEIAGSHIETVGRLKNCWHLWIGQKAGHEEDSWRGGALSNRSRCLTGRDPLRTCRVSQKTWWQTLARPSAASWLSGKRKQCSQNAWPYSRRQQKKRVCVNSFIDPIAPRALRRVFASHENHWLYLSDKPWIYRVVII